VAVWLEGNCANVGEHEIDGQADADTNDGTLSSCGVVLRRQDLTDPPIEFFYALSGTLSVTEAPTVAESSDEGDTSTGNSDCDYSGVPGVGSVTLQNGLFRNGGTGALWCAGDLTLSVGLDSTTYTSTNATHRFIYAYLDEAAMPADAFGANSYNAFDLVVRCSVAEGDCSAHILAMTDGHSTQHSDSYDSVSGTVTMTQTPNSTGDAGSVTLSNVVLERGEKKWCVNELDLSCDGDCFSP
jgi:hypothetical protein